MVTPACAVTVAGAPAATDTEVRCWVVSTSTYPAPVPPAVSRMGDQLWLMPLARSRYPLARAQLASVTTSLADAGAQVQTSSMAIMPAQFWYACW